ncbi:SGNH/GDSL hydrolase family protein [Mucilaginibacter corticis]|uniref:SGNH/GDSL hydrolase family protein n=1 Tax=Mucilaginibacter corticis TaxID=2597670 RepID=A0A556MUP6_9SPHI|nr:SGNH/GDSL hydrolase family protein [Mucilaginibacter corticis]TSJ43585.1 SGNH/GDSL hydrolase family protein [Mucilaginibacter corticis]
MKRLLAVLYLCFGSVVVANAQTVRPFKQGDRVVFTGNSITDGGHYHSYIWLYYLTHYPNMRFRVFNAGIGGDVAQQIYDRLDSDIFVHKPTLVTLTFGMNDTGYQNLPKDKADSTYKALIAKSLASFKLIEDKLKQHPEADKVMIASSPYDETSTIKATPFKDKNAAIMKIAQQQQLVATQNKWSYLDFNTPMLQINAREQQRDPMFTLQGSDRIHPSNDGQMVMAYVFLKAQGLANNKVAKVVINPAAKKAETAENCVVTQVNVTPSSIKFNYLAKSLPYPTDTIPSGWGSPQKSQRQALPLIPFTDEFNQEILQVKGLQSAQYQLKIDDKPIGTFAAADLEKGLNLATLTNTPQYQQAMSVMLLNEERWEIERRFREYYWIEYVVLKPKGLLFNDSEAVADSVQTEAKKNFFIAMSLSSYRKARFKSVRDTWNKEMDLLIDQMYTINKPVTRHFELVAVK